MRIKKMKMLLSMLLVANLLLQVVFPVQILAETGEEASDHPYETEDDVFEEEETETPTLEEVTLYVATTGSDSTGNGTLEQPYATTAYALTVLDKLNAKSRKLVLLDDTTYTSATHTNMVEIVGNTPTVKLTIPRTASQGPIAVGGPTIFRDLTTGQYFYPASNGHNVSYENIQGGGSSSSTSLAKVYVGTIDANGGQDGNVTLTSFGTSGASMLRICGVAAATSDVNLTLNSGKFLQVMIEGAQTFQGDVNVTINGGTYSSKIGYLFSDATVFHKHFQLIMNDGSGYTNVDDSLRGVVSNGRSWFMYDDVNETSSSVSDDSKQYAGCRMEVTDTAGTFHIVNESTLDTVYAVATNLDHPLDVYYSDASTSEKKGTLSVPAGEWMVSYITELPDWYCTGAQIIFNRDVADFDFAAVEVTEFEDKVIVGWNNGQELATGNTFAAGTCLDAIYAQHTKSINFRVEGTEIRLDDEALRFKIGMNVGLLEELDSLDESKAEYGVIAKKAENHDKSPAIIPAENLYSQYSDHITYTLCLTDIAKNAEAYAEEYIVQGFIKFKDRHGVERIIYTDTKQTSVMTTASEMLADDTVSDSIKATLNKLYMGG